MLASKPSPNPSSRAWRVVLWNTLLSSAALILIITFGEVYMRLTVPFIASSSVSRFVPNVGFLYEPYTVVRYTNRIDFWTESKVNRFGFLDREPIAPKRAEESCHIAIIGDSFVEARQVPLAKRLQVQLENTAKESLPELDVTTSAFGRVGSGQIYQLPFYDHYTRTMNADLLVLVFVVNDFMDNSSFLRNAATPLDPDNPPHAFAQKLESGEIVLRPPNPEFEKHKILEWPRNNAKIILPNSFFGYWLAVKTGSRLLNRPNNTRSRVVRKVNILRNRPKYASITADWKMPAWQVLALNELLNSLNEDQPLRVFLEAFEFTEFGLDQFKKRADRDGFSLAILATESLSTPLKVGSISAPMRGGGGGRMPIDLLREMADIRGIPVIDLYDYLLRQGGRIESRLSAMRFAHDRHWNETGHRWAAEAVLEYLKENQGICDTRTAIESGLE